MKKLFGIFLFSILISLLCSCTLDLGIDLDDTNKPEDTNNPDDKPSGGDENNNQGNNNNQNNNDIIDSGDITIEDLYDINNKVRFEITVSDEELLKIQEDYKEYSAKGSKSPIYRMCDNVKIIITKNNKDHVFEYNQVGIRMKGNTSKTEFIDENSKEIYRNIHLKLSFNETFDDPYYYSSSEILSWTDEEKLIRSEREFLGQSAIDLRYNKCKDSSYIKEYYALEMFRAFGIVSQHSNFTELCINHNGKSLEYGLYLMTEAASKTFIKNSLKSTNSYIGFDTWKNESVGTFGVENKKYGQLYKASYGLGNVVKAPDMTSSNANLFGIEDQDGYVPPYELKTNKDVIDNSLIINAFNKINKGTCEDIASVVDLNYFAMYEAIATIVGSPDDLRNNSNNYMLYFRRTDGKMTIIPIDQDRVFGIGSDWDPSGDNMTGVSQYSFYMAASGQRQVNKLYLKTILADTEWKDLYLANIGTVLTSDWVTNEKFVSVYNIVYNNYKDYVKTTLFGLDFSLETKDGNLSFNDYITRKIATLTNSDSNDDNQGGNNNQNTGGQINMASISEIYLAGYKNWDFDNEFKFELNSENNYCLSFLVEKGFEFKIRTKFINGKEEWYSAANGEVLHQGDNIIISSEYVGKTITIIIDSTGKLTYTFA